MSSPERPSAVFLDTLATGNYFISFSFPFLFPSLSLPPLLLVSPSFFSSFDFGIIEDFGYGICEKDGTPFLGEDGEQEVMTISTTRLETMLGDTGVAVHPEDPRYVFIC